MTLLENDAPYNIEQYKKPTVMVDIVIFTIANNSLQVLLIKRGIPPFQGDYALPGGALRLEIDENLEAAARRELLEETGVDKQYLEQLFTYGGPRRDPRTWTVSVAYFALVAMEDVTLKAGSDASEARWHRVVGNGVEVSLAFDHAEILQKAITRLRAKLDYTDIAVHLLPKEFTLPELQRVYEIILQEKLNKGSFRLRVDRAGIVQPIKNKKRTGSNRPAQLYQFVQHPDRVFFPRSIAWALERKNRES